MLFGILSSLAVICGILGMLFFGFYPFDEFGRKTKIEEHGRFRYMEGFLDSKKFFDSDSSLEDYLKGSGDR